jgi:hypothetical protein
VQSLIDHHQPSCDHRAVPRDQPLRRQPATDGQWDPQGQGVETARDTDDLYIVALLSAVFVSDLALLIALFSL